MAEANSPEELLDMYGLRWWKIVEKVKGLLQV